MNWEAGKTYRILYESESGGNTERTIDLIQTSHARDGRVFLRAFCHLRGEERTFRTDRIQLAELLSPDKRQSSPAKVRAPVLALKHVPGYSAPSPRSDLAIQVAREESIARRSGNSQEPPVLPKTRKTLGDYVGSVVGYGIAAIFILSFLGNSGFFAGFSSGTSYGTTASHSSTPAPSPPTSRPSPPKPSVEDSTIAGLILRTYRNGAVEHYEVPALGLATTNKAEAIAAIRIPRFVAATGLTEPALHRRYLAADLNGSGKLSFDELEVFQKKTYDEFRYESNELALRPDEFLAIGGGDCEDFALYTAGLLRYWGWEPYLGSLGPSHGGVGHALCLSFEEGAFSGSFTYFTVESWVAEDGTALQSGKYVPIDYDHIGSLSNAVGKGWKLRAIYVPEKAWGLRM